MTDDPTQAEDAHALAAVMYDELRRLARAYMRRERTGQTLQATALVHEAYLRLASAGTPWRDKRHFVGIAARSMRQILVERARARGSQKRWAGLNRVSFSDSLAVFADPARHLIRADARQLRPQRVHFPHGVPAAAPPGFVPTGRGTTFLSDPDMNGPRKAMARKGAAARATSNVWRMAREIRRRPGSGHTLCREMQSEEP